MIGLRESSLRRRLVLSVTGLIAIAGLVVGIALPLILRGFLIDRVDAQLADAAERVRAYYDDDRPGADASSAAEGLVQPGQSVGTLGAFFDKTNVTACAYLDGHGTPTVCSAKVVAAIGQLYVSDDPSSVHLPGLGGYRVMTVQTTDGIYVVGLPLRGASETIGQLVIVELVVVSAVLVLAALVTATIIGRSLRPLRRVAATAKQVSQLQLATGEVDLRTRVAPQDAQPATEAGQVGAALNQLLDHVGGALEARYLSESRVRAFVADASHELRTPLAAIRGYAELTRRSGQEVPYDVAHALNRIESEAQRMTALVEDLLLLARLDSGRPLRSESVDLVPLMLDALSDAHAAGPGYTWEVDIAEDSIEIDGDSLRLQQVLANLLSNARTHTPEGTTVTSRLRRTPDGAGAVIEVIDNGPGIAPDMLRHIFDRFARADSSRSRAKGSTGLGLAIVYAVVTSHRGQVSVHSVPGQTTFQVSLPISADRSPPAT